MNNRFTGLLTLAALLSSSAMGAELRVTSTLGHDTNPFRLSDNFLSAPQSYWNNSVDYKLEDISSWFVQLGYDKKQSELDTADSTSSLARVGYKTAFSKSEHELEFSLTRRSLDTSFVSRFTGDLFEAGGLPAGDRYDYRRWTAQADVRFKLSKSQQLIVGLEHRLQDYTDLGALGISNLDYDHSSIELTWQNDQTKWMRYSLAADLGSRSYDSRLASDFLGFPIFGLTSEYDYAGLSIKTRFKPDKYSRVYANISYQTRSDNADGFNDTESLIGQLRYAHRTADKSTFVASLVYRDLTFDRAGILTDLEIEGESPSSSGWQLSLSYQLPLLKQNGIPISWLAKYSYYEFSAELSAYEYERSVLETGLIFDF